LEGPAKEARLSDSARVDQKRAASELGEADRQLITEFWNPEVSRRNLDERFSQGASLWLLKCGDELRGYVWTLRGGTIEPYYFPLGANDFHFFDLWVFPEYRGWSMIPLLVKEVARRLAAEGGSRAFCEVAEWNQASLFFQRLTGFRRLGCARKLTLFGRTLVWRSAKESPKPISNQRARSSGDRTKLEFSART